MSSFGKTLMVQGTTSDAGKTTLVAGFCKVFARADVSVAPFKPQNMALNSAVTLEGGEIGRSQALQAYACGLEPHTDMNPILLKPNSDTGAQVIVQGRAIQNLEAEDYHRYKPVAMQVVRESHQRLTDQYNLVLVEGAGSPAEINLRKGDIANMGFAEAVDCPVILVADIDRGGVFAHLVGTLDLLSDSEQNRVVGFVINRFRGDIALLEDGLDWLEQKTGKPVLGVLPYLKNLNLDAEDTVDAQQSSEQAEINIKVLVFPRISNHTDFDALRLHPQVNLEYVGEHAEAGKSLEGADLIILPGSKSVRADLDWMRRNGYHRQIEKHLRYGGKLLGICGGFQMLGNILIDDLGIEGVPGQSDGLGLLELDTQLLPEKQLTQVSGNLAIRAGGKFSGYEIHCGQTAGAALERPFLHIDGSPLAEGSFEGAVSKDDSILGTYVHGLLDQPEALSDILSWAGLEAPEFLDRNAIRDVDLDRLADCIESHMNWQKFSAATGLEWVARSGEKERA